MQPFHAFLALLVVAVWGTNFVVIKVGLHDFPPFFFAMLRFLFSALPFMFFVKRPAVRTSLLALFGIFLGAGQFGLLFLAMRSDISPGLASLVIQIQVFFTIGLSVALFHERVGGAAYGGLLLAVAGLAVIGFHIDASVTAAGLAMVLGAALFWACANIVVKRAGVEHGQRNAGARIDMLGFMVWSSVFAVPPLFAMSLLFDGPTAGLHSLAAAHWDAWAAVAWQVVGNMLFGYAAWNWLLTRYDAAIVTPYALLVPVFGMGASSLLLGEALPGWKVLAALLVMAGLALLTLWPVLLRRLRAA